MVTRNISDFLESDTKQPGGNIECAITNIFQLEVGFYFFFIKGEPFTANFLCVIPPVPGCEFKIAAIFLDPGLQVLRFTGYLFFAGAQILSNRPVTPAGVFAIRSSSM